MKKSDAKQKERWKKQAGEYSERAVNMCKDFMVAEIIPLRLMLTCGYHWHFEDGQRPQKKTTGNASHFLI